MGSVFLCRAENPRPLCVLFLAKSTDLSLPAVCRFAQAKLRPLQILTPPGLLERYHPFKICSKFFEKSPQDCTPGGPYDNPLEKFVGKFFQNTHFKQRKIVSPPTFVADLPRVPLQPCNRLPLSDLLVILFKIVVGKDCFVLRTNFWSRPQNVQYQWKLKKRRREKFVMWPVEQGDS